MRRWLDERLFNSLTRKWEKKAVDTYSKSLQVRARKALPTNRAQKP